jgi:SAM-dependent methyltransferase
MSLIDRIHGRYVHQRRINALMDHLVELIPPGAHALDIGCGDGSLASLIMQRRPDTTVSGIDVLIRHQTSIPIAEFNGQEIPYDDASFDVVMFVDVLHHTEDPMTLLREAARVARQSVIIKDHTHDGLLAGPTLRFMDRVGNARFGVALTYNYWPSQKWQVAFETLGLRTGVWKTNLGLYPRPASWLFDRTLHFVARLDIQ